MYNLLNIGKTYQTPRRSVTPLSGVNLRIEDGELIAIQGPTGGGKSTLLQMLGALDRPSTGSIHLAGEDLGALSESRRGAIRAREIGFIFQGFNLLPTLTARENVETALVPLGVRAAEREDRALEALAAVGLADRHGHLPGELSGGQQQRVAIARALVKKPRVILADEPTGNLDESTRDDILALLEGLWREEGLTMIIVTHDSAVAARAPRRLYLGGGSVREMTASGR
ncbi:ABC transporter ATP-binding protein [Mycetocola spongiae]|uniref:ABC transporter ATP-binding protein n=1 Tax=Mycetocola spongiae TaxID=2859226 RepID=UPI001CF3DBDB|nr:ABC transporter ATP-binding protein [Mycetocola spongiae]UCR88390.1 ABC transporter ATP-binding protein [Mycetocola spongiae]